MRLIARAEQFGAGLARKLLKRGHDEDSANAVISSLREQNLINDRRYAQLWIQSRSRFALGPLKLLSSLSARGIERDDAQAALKTVLDEETELAMLARFVKKHEKKRKGRADNFRLRHLLKSEGFSTRAIKQFFNED